MWATVLAQLAQGRGGRRRKVARSSGLAKRVCCRRASLSQFLFNVPSPTREQTKLPTRDSHTQREIKIVNSPVCVSSVCARRRHVLAQIKSNKGAGKEREGREEGREQAKAADKSQKC